MYTCMCRIKSNERQTFQNLCLVSVEVATCLSTCADYKSLRHAPIIQGVHMLGFLKHGPSPPTPHSPPLTPHTFHPLTPTPTTGGAAGQ